MYDAEFHIMMSEKEEHIHKLFNFFNYGLHNCKKYKILMRLLAKEKESSNLQKELEKYQTDNLKIEVLRFKSDEPAYKKCSYLTDIAMPNLHSARWYIGMDEDTISDIDGWMDRLDEDFDWEREVYATPPPMKNVQPMEYDLACLIGKQHWYNPEGGPFHEWEVSCISQKAMKTILNCSESLKVINLRKKIATGWGDHFMGLTGRLAKVHPVGTTYLNGTHMILEHTLLGGWIVHAHHIYRLPCMQNMLPLFKDRCNGEFGGRKVFLTEIFPDRKEDRGFHTLEKNGVILSGYKGVGMWTSPQPRVIHLHLFTLKFPLIFNLDQEDFSEPLPADSSLLPEQQNVKYQILAG